MGVPSRYRGSVICRDLVDYQLDKLPGSCRRYMNSRLSSQFFLLLLLYTAIKLLFASITDLLCQSIVMPSSEPQKVLNVGLIGCGEVAQVVHIPTLSHMSQWFRITYLCDVSSDALEHCAAKIPNHVPKTTRDPSELCASDDVDAVLVVNSDEYHAAHAVLALQYNKHVLVEKPLALTSKDIREIIEVEKNSQGKLMVGYMRRYAAPFEDAVREIGGLDKILYARVRGIQESFRSRITEINC